jgi:hypothetical protein
MPDRKGGVVPLVQTDAIVSIATANDEDHPASNVIDG